MNMIQENLRSKNLNPLLLCLFIILAMVSRFALPPFLGHPDNFSPIDSIALFSGSYFGRKWIAFLLPLFSVWVSDLVVNFQYFHHWVWLYPGFYFQYGFYLIVVLFSSWFLQKNKAFRVPFSAVAVSIAFFLISNFGVWLGYSTYPHTLNGLILCYTAGLPFYRSTLISDLGYSIVLFGVVELISINSKRNWIKLPFHKG
jgi:hypothetical protein